jgi:hypothetical protein
MAKNTAFSFLIAILLILSGCVTADSLRKIPEEKLKYYSGFYAENLYRQEIVNRHPEWPEKVKQAILKGSVSMNMTKQQARAAWGEPYKINRTVTQSGIHEQWVYNCVGALSFLYFENDILTSWQN